MASSFKNASATISSANTRTDIYTAPSSTTSVIHNLNIANVDASINIAVDVEVYDDSEGSYSKLGNSIVVPVQTTLFWDKPINLETGDKLVVTATSADDCEVFVSVLEIT